MQGLTSYQKAQLKIECARISFTTGSKVDIEKDGCMDVAKKIYKFVLEDKESSPSSADDSG